MGVQLAGDRLIRGAHDGLGFPTRQAPCRCIDQRRRLLDVTVGVIDAPRHIVVADREIKPASARPSRLLSFGRISNSYYQLGLVLGRYKTLRGTGYIGLDLRLASPSIVLSSILMTVSTFLTIFVLIPPGPFRSGGVGISLLGAR